MREWFKQLRYKLAYLIAPDWINDLEYRLGAFLCDQTGGFLSKSYYPLETMIMYANDFQQSLCDECPYYLNATRGENDVNRNET